MPKDKLLIIDLIWHIFEEKATSRKEMKSTLYTTHKKTCIIEGLDFEATISVTIMKFPSFEIIEVL